MNQLFSTFRYGVKVRVLLATGLIFGWLLLALPLYIANAGGSGLKQPQNIIAWIVMLGVITLLWSHRRRSGALTITDTSILLFSTVLLLAIPLLYTTSDWREAALFRWGGLFIGVIFYISLLKYNLPDKFNKIIMLAIILASFIQAVIASLQFIAPQWVPDWVNYPLPANRPTGVFQQPNVLASFIATGLTLALREFLFPSLILRSTKAAFLSRLLLASMLVIGSMVLVWIQSRVGWLGGVAAVVCLLTLGWSPSRRHTLQALGLIASGVVLAKLVELTGQIIDITHMASNHFRWEMILTTLKMIACHPLQGWGYGSFEYAYQHFRLEHGLPVMEADVVRHPHNEILLWWLEGGLIGLAGMTLIGFAGIRLVWRAWRIDFAGDRRAHYPLALSLVCALLPLALHSETEYPFMLSAAQWAIALYLFALVDKSVSPARPLAPAIKPLAGAANWLVPAVAALMVIALFASLRANIALTRFENELLVFGADADIAPARQAMQSDIAVNRERWHYDEQTWALMQFNETQDRQLLDGYARWAKSYLKRRVDPNVYANYLAIARYLHDASEAQRLQHEAHIMFPRDPRFSGPASAKRVATHSKNK